MKKGLVLLAISLLTLPMTADALTGSVDIECAKNELEVNESTTCTIKGKSDAEVTGLSMKLSSNLELSEVSVDKNVWQGDGTDGFITLYTDTNKTGDFIIGTFTATSKVEGSNEIKLDEIIFSDKDFNEVKLSSVKENIKFVADNSSGDKKDDITSENAKKENNDNESVVENPETGIALSIGMFGLVITGVILFAINNKKNYFYKI